MWNEPTKERLSKIPKLYETESRSLQDKQIHLHFFIGGSDWFICEYDEADELFFGYAILNNDYQMAEWGYVSFPELKSIRINGWLEIDCELEDVWKVRRACEIEKIRKAQLWPEPRKDKEWKKPACSPNHVVYNEKEKGHDGQEGIYRQ